MATDGGRDDDNGGDISGSDWGGGDGGEFKYGFIALLFTYCVAYLINDSDGNSDGRGVSADSEGRGERKYRFIQDYVPVIYVLIGCYISAQRQRRQERQQRRKRPQRRQQRRRSGN